MIPAIKGQTAAIAKEIQKKDEVQIVTHIDADGITAGAIAVQTLKQLGKSYSIEFIKQLDKSVVTRLQDQQYELVWFTDLGSSIVETTKNINMVVTDHHSCSDQTNIPTHLNPHLFGLDGSNQLSGAGATYLVSKSIDAANIQLAGLAIIGACGDLQDRKLRRPC